MVETEDSGGGGVSSDSIATADVLGEKVINDGLLCSILLALSGSPGTEDLISRIERDISDVSEILLARKKLFTFYSGIICGERKKLILDIERQTTRNYIKDIVDQLVKIDKVTDGKMFCMPFDYKIRKFETEEARVAHVIETEISNEFDLKIEALEKRMNEKNRALHDSILESVTKSLQQHSTSYAGAVLGARQVEGAGGGVACGVKLGVMGPPLPVGSGGGVSQQVGGTGSRQFSVDNRIRGRSPSVKRFRDNEGLSHDVQNVKSGRERSSSRPSQKKGVVGTSNNSVITSRKMRSPPADIFVWGIHPDTSIQDIVADLSESGIIIEEKDVQKKSKPEANLVSYKISVKAEDLQKALDPAVWPLRVRVREFIYYSRKTPRQQGQHGAGHGDNGRQGLEHGGADQYGGSHRQQGHHVAGHCDSGRQGREHGGADQYGGGHRQQGELLVAQNRYAMPGDGVPGGPLV